MDLQHHRVALPGVKARGRQHPGLHRALVRRSGHLQLPQLAQFAVGQQVVVEPGQAPRLRVTQAPEHQVGGPSWLTASPGHHALTTHGVIGAAVGTANRRATDTPGQFLQATARIHRREDRLAAVVVAEHQAPTIGGPARRLDAAIELRQEFPALAAVAVHHVEAVAVIAHAAVVPAGPGNQPPVGRDGRVVVAAAPLGERGDRTVHQGHAVEVGVLGVQLPVGIAVGGHHQGTAVRGPGDTAAVVEVTAGQLTRATPRGGDHEHMVVSPRGHALAVIAKDGSLDHRRRRRPLGALGGLGHLAQHRRVVHHPLAIGQPLPVRGPGELAGSARQTGQLGGLAAVEPGDEQLLAGLVLAHVGHAPPLGRQDRR